MQYMISSVFLKQVPPPSEGPGCWKPNNSLNQDRGEGHTTQKVDFFDSFDPRLTFTQKQDMRYASDPFAPISLYSPPITL